MREILASNSVSENPKQCFGGEEQNLPGKVVEEVVEENHGDDSLSIPSLVRMLELSGGQGNPDSERAAHSARGDQEERATATTVDHASPEPSLKHIDHQDESVEHILVIGAVDSECLQDIVQVVRRQAGAGELREDAASETDKYTVAVTSWSKAKRSGKFALKALFADEGCELTSLDQIGPTSLLFTLDDRSLHFGIFETNQRVVPVTVGMVLGEELEGFFVLASRHEPTRGFWQQEDQQDLDGRRGGLQQARKSP